MEKIGKIAIFLFIVGALVLTTACIPTTIESVKKEENVGNTVTVRGTVESSVKIGDFSGFTVKDSTGTIGVSTFGTLPTEGTSVSVTGILMRDTIFGYYIKQ